MKFSDRKVDGRGKGYSKGRTYYTEDGQKGRPEIKNHLLFLP